PRRPALPAQTADEHAGLDGRYRGPAEPAEVADDRAGDRVDQRRRARRGDAVRDPGAQTDPRPRPAEERRERLSPELPVIPRSEALPSFRGAKRSLSFRGAKRRGISFFRDPSLRSG